MKNQKGEERIYRFPSRRVTVLAFADREGSAQMEKWIQPLYTRFTDRIEICGVAELSAVPAFARGIAQGIISGLVKYPVLLDWEGKVSRAYEMEKAQTTLVIIDAAGKIRMKQKGDFSSEKFADITTLITSLLAA